MVLLVSTQFKGLEVVCCRQLPELHRSLTPRPHPSHKTVHQGHALLSILVYVFDVCAGGEKATGGGRESGSDAWKQYMRRSTW